MSAADAPSRHPVELLSVFDALRDRHDPATVSALVLSWLYVKSRQSDVWRAVVEAPDWQTKASILRDVRIPPQPPGDPVPAFQSLDPTMDSSIIDAIDKLDRVDFDAATGTTAAQLGSSVLEIAGRQLGGGGGHFTPPAVAQLIIDLANPMGGHEIFDPFCGSAELLVAAHRATARKHTGLDLFGCPPSATAKALSLMNLALHGVEADICTPGLAVVHEGFPGRRFDHVVMNPPFGLKVDVSGIDWAFGDPPGSRADLGWLQYAISKIKAGGRGAVLLPLGAGFRSGREAQIREALILSGVIECVIALPPALFAETSISTAIWIVRAIDDPDRGTGSILMIDADAGVESRSGAQRLNADLRRRVVQEHQRWSEYPAYQGDPGFSRVVSSAETASADFDLSPRRYVGVHKGRPTLEQSIASIASLHQRFEDTIGRLEIDNAAMGRAILSARESRQLAVGGRYVRLGAIADILAGRGFVPREDAAAVGMPMVTPRNIRDGVIGSHGLDKVGSDTVTRLKRYELRDSDIVTARTGTLGRFGRVAESQNGWLLGPGCVRIRLLRGAGYIDSIDTTYLTNYLNSQPVREWMTTNMSGSAIPHISVSRLRQLPVWLPSLSAQRKSAEQLESLRLAARTYQEMAELAIAMRGELASAFVPANAEPGDWAPRSDRLPAGGV
ncbi:N-6 DNA methylase [Nocardia mangyaensis]|uniref:N-6 DNA methylase n=1 Tax=Nocardia mangyaensis TaxID=2213200 RepID=UPI00267451C0|nr:N-6 DNA methylase [Nocardia mangyaensis]MDO3648945.1 N-6 DNA methylase [Nocardia mangyaensis]